MAEGGDEPGGFLARWSRRKRMPEEDGGDADGPPAEPEAGAPDPDAAEDALAAELDENRRAAEAVDIDSLSYEDDFKLFLKRGVPDVLRKKALRRLWRSNPVLANLDGLNDYDDDFADPAHNFYKSIWKVGGGFLSELERQAQQDTGRIAKAPEPEGEPGEEEAGSADEAESDAPAPDAAVENTPVAAAEDSEPDTPEPAEESGEEEPQGPRRVSIRRRLEG